MEDRIIRKMDWMMECRMKGGMECRMKGGTKRMECRMEGGMKMDGRWDEEG